MIIHIQKILSVLHHQGSFKAALTWSKFSATSYIMISSLVKQGILPKTIIDVGANVGQFAVAAAKLFPSANVHSFEPNPACVTKLRNNLRKLGNVFIYPLALGDETGQVEFHVNSHSHSSSILPLDESHRKAFPSAFETGTIKVELSTLDSVFKDIHLAKPVLLKLDVQGYEDRALRGGTSLLKRVDYVVLEASFKPMYKDEMLFIDIVHLMEKNGFSFLRPIGFLHDPSTEEIIQMDALFYKK